MRSLNLYNLEMFSYDHALLAKSVPVSVQAYETLYYMMSYVARAKVLQVVFAYYCPARTSGA